MAKRKKLYTVHKGRAPGVYQAWAECQQQTDNFSGQVYEGFGADEREKAEHFVTHGEIPVITSKYYIVASGPKPGVYTSWAKAQLPVQGHSGTTWQGFNSLVEAEAWLIDQKVDASATKIFQSYFAQYPEFEPDCNRPFDEEFTRLAQSQDWVPNSQQYHEERTLAIKEEIQNEYWEPALHEEELSQLTQEERKAREDEWNIRGYQTLLREVYQEPRDTVKECVEVLQKTLVNIVDLLGARRIGTKVEVFECFQDFKAHTMKPGKRIHLAASRKDAFLSTLLQELRKSRGLNGKAYKIPQVRKARVSKSRKSTLARLT